MNHPASKNRKVREAMPNLLTAEPNPELVSTKAATHEETSGPLDAPDSPGAPAPPVMLTPPPVMLTPRIAWGRLCAATGGGIGMRTFYQWIAKEEISSVRMGRNVLIPAEALDNLIKLIKQCLAGLLLTPRLALRRLCARTGCVVPLGSLYLWIAAGKIDSVRAGGRIFIPVEAVDDLIEQCLRGEQLY
jgi:excisionase family DNA binding protein